jgi:hypothetical protein
MLNEAEHHTGTITLDGSFSPNFQKSKNELEDAGMDLRLIRPTILPS